MIGIYLCDDDSAARLRIQGILERKIMIEDYDMSIVCSASAPDLLLDAAAGRGGKRGLYFLDVDLRDDTWDGFLLGQEIRRLDPHATLVYITGYGELACRTFQYHLEVFDYIVKDPARLEESVSRCLEAIQARLAAEQRDPEDIFTLRTGDTLRHIPLGDILFFETAPTPHHVLLHTAGCRVDFLGSLNELEQRLGGRFLRVHRAYLVAADRIEEVDLKRNRLKVGGRECLVSRAGKAVLRRKLAGEV